MPRSESEIQADIDAMKASGVHQSSGKLRPLRDEMKAAKAAASPAAPRATTTSDVASAVVAPSSFGAEAEWKPLAISLTPESIAATQWWQPEEQFLDRLITEIAAGIDYGTGSMSGVVKKMYERVDAALKIRRILIDVMKGLKPGENLPQFSTLKRNPATGEQIFTVSSEPIPGVALPKSPPPEFAHVTEGGMPVRSKRPSSADLMAAYTAGVDMGAPSGADPAAGVKQALRAQIEARPPVSLPNGQPV